MVFQGVIEVEVTLTTSFIASKYPFHKVCRKEFFMSSRIMSIVKVSNGEKNDRKETSREKRGGDE